MLKYKVFIIAAWILSFSLVRGKTIRREKENCLISADCDTGYTCVKWQDGLFGVTSSTCENCTAGNPSVAFDQWGFQIQNICANESTGWDMFLLMTVYYLPWLIPGIFTLIPWYIAFLSFETIVLPQLRKNYPERSGLGSGFYGYFFILRWIPYSPFILPVMFITNPWNLGIWLSTLAWETRAWVITFALVAAVLLVFPFAWWGAIKIIPLAWEYQLLSFALGPLVTIVPIVSYVWIINFQLDQEYYP